MILLGSIVFLAYLTTSCSLVTAISQYFHQLFPRISYKTLVYANCLVSYLLANQGLTAIIKTSVPILAMIYPVTMTLVALLILHRFLPLRRIQFQVPLIVVLLASFFSILVRNHVVSASWYQALPLYQLQFEWILFMVVTFLFSSLFVGQERALVFEA